MVGASKILTVSYGTFSCTLEGFEEPFSTMKAIAEYFRDLAADDRYFGAEPPTPDAEMLHRIAEREIQRRVEAKISEHGIVLRAETAPAAQPAAHPVAGAAALTTAAAAPAVAGTAAAPMPPAEAAPDAFEIEADADAAADVFADYLQEEATTAPADERADTDSVAAKLSRIRAVVAAAQAAPAAALEDEESAADLAPTATVPAGDFGFELDLNAMPERPAAASARDDDALVGMDADDTFEEIEETAATELEAEADIKVEAEADEIAATEAGAEEIEAIAEVDVPEAAEAEEVEAEAVAVEDAFEEEAGDDTVLAGIEELFVGSIEEELDAAALAETEAPEAEEAAAEDDMAEEDVAEEAVEEEEIAAAALDLGAWRLAAEDDQAFTWEDTAEEDIDVEAKLEDESEVASEAEDEIEMADEAEVEAEDEAEIETETEAAAETDDAEAAEEIAPEPTTSKPGFFGQAAARVIKIRKSLTQVRDEAPAHDMAGDEAGDETDESAADEIAEETADETAAAPERDDSEDRNAAIFAALNEEAALDEEFDEAEAEDVTAEDTDAALLAGIGAAIGQTGLDPDAEDELLRELANVAREARRDGHEGRAILEGHASDGEASVERLMEEAKSKLEGDETRRRFSAISHLKAAVVATVADRKLKLREAPVSGEAEAGEEIERYRDDLSKAVRPRRPASESAPTTRRPTIETRLAPLVLVSEQRIDAPDGPRSDAAVVRPRRISAGNLVLSDDIDQTDEPEAVLSPEEAKSFAEFADRLGAVNLSDMLEAAAAYTATVEGLPHFSRPQILRKVANVAEDDEYSREDGLRSFGMLLRQGKIQKIRRGQFTITEASKFMSEARRAAR